MRSALILLLIGTSMSAGAQRFQSTIQSYLQKEKAQWQLSDTDINNWIVTNQYDNQQTDVTYTYLTQHVDGIRIFNAVSTMVIRDNNVLHFANRFHPNAAKRANAIQPTISAEEAISAAAIHLGLTVSEAPRLIEKEPTRLRYIYTKAGISREEIKVELVLVSIGDELRLAWNIGLPPLRSSDWWNMRIDALNGAFIGKNNRTLYCDFGHPHQHGSTCEESRMPADLFSAPIEVLSDSGRYNVYALPLEAPSFGGRRLLIDPHHAGSSPYGWHDVNGAEGAEYTITRGNNVYVYEDLGDLNAPGYSPDGGLELNFDFPIDLAQDPTLNQDAVLTNLFYMNNVLHDILYVHGFDEAAGNFQATNYTGEGLGGDFVVAEGQDGGGTNNANFYTPEEGESGRMQMYFWPVEVKVAMEVKAPDTIAGFYVAVAASFGPSLETPITGKLVLVNDGLDVFTDACDGIQNNGDLAGNIALIDRGNCTYLTKANIAEAAGAIAIVVVNNVPSPPFAMGGSGSSGIPGVMISQADGEILKAHLLAGDTVDISLAIGAGEAGQTRDGSLDNGIIAHEFGHGLSNRLTGGADAVDCLNHAEQGGEGWSDWLGLILTIEPGDAGTDSRGIGTYATVDDEGLGLRRFPYSTDMSINPQTYGDLGTSNGVHARGEIWSQALWDVTWALIDAEGFDQDWINGTGGNITALKLVIEGMKLQGCNPGYVNARDGILAADEIFFGNAHRCLLWEAFAKRGLGAYADQGGFNQVGDEFEDFSIPNTCLIATVAPTADFIPDVLSSCLGNFVFTDLSTDIPQYYLWDFGDGNTSALEDPFHSYAVKGIYTVTLIVNNNVGADTFQLEVAYENTPAPAISGNRSVCEGSSTLLTADVIDGNTSFWSIGDSIVYAGTSFLTPPFTSPVTYTVKQQKDDTVRKVGPANNTFAGGGNHNTNFNGRLLFETFAPMRLISVLMYAQGDYDRTIELRNEANEVIQTVVVFLTTGENRVTLLMDIPTPGRYSLGNFAEDLYRNNEGATYPYTVDNLVSIYSSNATSSELTFYYYFYDWEVQEIACQGDVADITIDVTPGPLASFLIDAIDLTATFTDISSAGAVAWSWNFGDGSPISNEQNPVHLFPAEGVYQIELTVSNGTCFSTYMETLEVGITSASNDPDDTYGLKVYPNPAKDEVTIEWLQAYQGQMRLHVYDATGSMVMSRALESNATRIAVNTSSLAAGAYQLQIIGEEGISVRRVTIIK